LQRAIVGAQNAGAEVKRINVREIEFSPCTACEACRETGVCVLKDGMTKIYPLLTQTDHIIVAAPIYFMSVPGRFKCLIDRCQALWFAKNISPSLIAQSSSGIKRAGAFLASCGHVGGEIMFPPAEKVIVAFMKTLDMNLRHMLYAPDTDAVGAIEPSMLDQAEKIGAIMANLT